MEITLVIRNNRSESRHSMEIEPFRTILDALERIRTDGKPDLVYRHSCHHGSCGTCGAMVNGKPQLMCITKVGDFAGEEIVVEPLKKAVRLEGIAVWPGRFYMNLPETSYLRKVNETYEEKPMMRLEDCIECGVCFAACPVDEGFLGPAALASARIELAKSPGRRVEMLAFAARPDGAEKCERFFECSKVCPRNVAPGRRITELLALLK